MLHCLENLNAEEFPTRVSPETMHKAVRLSQFYCSQFLLLQSKSAQQPLEGLLLDILKFIQQSGGKISTRDLCRSRFKNSYIEGKKMTSATAGKLLKEIADAGFGNFVQVGNSRVLSLSQLSPTVTDCHRTVTDVKSSDSKALGAKCHQMTETYVSENFDSRTEHLSVENSKNLEDIQFCHLVTVDAESNTQQALDIGDSPVTVGDTGDSAILNKSEIELLEMLQKVVTDADHYFAQQVRGILLDNGNRI